MSDQIHCLLCGSVLHKKMIESRERDECPICGWVYYPQLKVTAGVVVEKEGKILLVKRNMDPWKSCWYLPAGFVENDESPHDAAEREAHEETGLEIMAGKLIDVVFYNDDPRGNGIVILYEGIIKGGSIKKNSEALDIQFISKNKVKYLNLAGGSHNVFILKWLGKISSG